jgi:hypothetical protein
MRFILSFLLVSLFAGTSVAQSPVIFPAGTTLTVQGVQYKAFTLEEYKTLALIYTDYETLFKKVPILEERLQLHLDMAKVYTDQVSNCEHMMGEYKTNGEHWKARFDETTKLAKKEAFLDHLEKYGLWAVVVVETGYIVVMSIRGLAAQ